VTTPPTPEELNSPDAIWKCPECNLKFSSLFGLFMKMVPTGPPHCGQCGGLLAYVGNRAGNDEITTLEA